MLDGVLVYAACCWSCSACRVRVPSVVFKLPACVRACGFICTTHIHYACIVHLHTTHVVVVSCVFVTHTTHAHRWLDVIRRHSNVKLVAPDASSHPQPQPPIGALRPRLAKARTLFMSGSAVEPQWMRGGWGTLVGRPGCFWFETAAWRKAAGALQVLLTRCGHQWVVLFGCFRVHAVVLVIFVDAVCSKKQNCFVLAARTLPALLLRWGNRCSRAASSFQHRDCHQPQLMLLLPTTVVIAATNATTAATGVANTTG